MEQFRLTATSYPTSANKLYVIGNGFDLWHGIPSSYGDFKQYVRHHDHNLFEAVENYLPTESNWSDLEDALANVDVDGIIDNLGDFMVSYSADDWSDSYHHDFQYEVDLVVQRLSTELRTQFGQWIRTLKIPTPDTATKCLTTIDKGAIFLSFNYTSTLKDLYGVADGHVLHIHGNAAQQDQELILGHSWNPKQRKSLNDRPDIEEVDTRLMEANNILDNYFSTTFKPSQQLIQEHSQFFTQLNAIDTVCVLGHSLSDVDRPYFQAILSRKSIATAQWYIACRSNEDCEKKSARLTELGVNSRRVVTVLWEDF